VTGHRQAESPAADTGDAAALRVCVAPRLTEYGPVAKLTQTGGMTTIDFFFGLRRMGR
jgi:hypothetical protein